MPTEKERSAADPGLRHGAALAPLAGDFLCPGCGYNLRGLTRDRCPECGRPFERARLSESALPWLRRRWRGRFRAYWATVWLLTVHPGRLAAEFAHPVSYPDAQRFRWLTIFWAWLPLGFSSILFLASGDEDFLMLGSSHLATDVWLVSGFNLAAVFALIALTGVPSYFFHPRRLPVEYQNRGVALSYYACAQLAWAPVVYVISAMADIISG